MPIHITSVKRAVSLLFLGIADGLDASYQTYSWEDLQDFCLEEIDREEDFHVLTGVSRNLPIPKVIVLQEFEKLPHRSVRFSRQHIFMRDRYTCQYCKNEFPRAKLNLDHVLPRSRGGKTSWENVVTSCVTCNREKADRTPSEANMPLMKHPKRPRGTLGLMSNKQIYKSWTPFMIPELS